MPVLRERSARRRRRPLTFGGGRLGDFAIVQAAQVLGNLLACRHCADEQPPGRPPTVLRRRAACVAPRQEQSTTDTRRRRHVGQPGHGALRERDYGDAQRVMHRITMRGNDSVGVARCSSRLHGANAALGASGAPNGAFASHGFGQRAPCSAAKAAVRADPGRPWSRRAARACAAALRTRLRPDRDPDCRTCPWPREPRPTRPVRHPAGARRPAGYGTLEGCGFPSR